MVYNLYNLLCFVAKRYGEFSTSLRPSTHSAAAFNQYIALRFCSLSWGKWLQRRENSHDVTRIVSLFTTEGIYPLGICEAKYNISLISPKSLDMIRLRMMRPNTSMD